MRAPRFWTIATRVLLFCGPLLAAASSAEAHQVWLEPDADGTKLYFGEFGDNLHEVSPGYLDKLTLVSASALVGGEQKPLESRKVRDGITIVGRAGKGGSVVAVDLAYPLIESKDGSKTVRTAWTPAARYVPELGAREPRLVLDVVPTNAAGEFQVTFRGAPLPKAELSLVAASGWSLAGTTDAAGKVTFRLPWKGTYALLVRHKEAVAGKRKTPQGADESFDAASFGTTLTFVTSAGLPSPPPPPPAPPNQP